MTCDTCKHWQETESTNGVGECRHDTPVPADDPDPNGYYPRGQWPKTLAADWCSQFEAKP